MQTPKQTPFVDLDGMVRSCRGDVTQFADVMAAMGPPVERVVNLAYLDRQRPIPLTLAPQASKCLVWTIAARGSSAYWELTIPSTPDHSHQMASNPTTGRPRGYR